MKRALKVILYILFIPFAPGYIIFYHLANSVHDLINGVWQWLNEDDTRNLKSGQKTAKTLSSY